ncbi:MAG TPA: hypothetical protein VGC82_08015, partial [Rhodopila sp.]
MDIAIQSSPHLAVQIISQNDKTDARSNDGRRREKQTEAFVHISRRGVLLGSAGALSAATLPFAKPA